MEGELWVFRDEEDHHIVCRVYGEALQLGDIDSDDEYKHITHICRGVKSNTALKRGVAGGCGVVGAIGIRYRYTEPKGTVIGLVCNLTLHAHLYSYDIV